MYTTDKYEAVTAETIVIPGHNGDLINAFYARPTGAGPMPGLVLIHHAPGWDDWYKECTFKMARAGYATITPNLYGRLGHGTIEEVMLLVRGAGGVADEQVVGDVNASMRFLRAQPYLNGRVGVMGTCSGGRHSYLAACSGGQYEAIVDLWGGGVVMRDEDLNEKRPVSPVTLTPNLVCPILGIFGDEDRAPTPEQVNIHEEELKKHGKDYEFHRYPEAGHGFFYYDRAAYRQAQAVDGWSKVMAFLEKQLS